MGETKIDFEKLQRFFKGQNENFEYIRELFCDKSREDELQKLLRRQWYEMFHEEIEDEKDLSHILYRIHFEINSRKEFIERKGKIRNILKVLTRVAAVLFIPLLFYTGINLFSTSGYIGRVPVEIKAPAWTRVEFSLPDGTKGWLNSRSSIKYYSEPRFNREITLNGEAFFDVAKDKKKNFKVVAGDAIVTVFGTKFNIAAYDNEKIVEVVLEEGSLSFSDKESKKSCLMSPCEMVVYNKINKSVTTDTVQTHKYTSWKEGKLVFRNDPMDVVARRLERWYNVEVELRDIFPDEVRLRATFVDEDLKEVLYLLKKILKVDYKIVERSLDRDDVYLKKKVILMKR